MQTPIQEIMHWIEVRMSLYPDQPNLSERGGYDAYLNILNIAKSKMSYEKVTMKNLFEGGAQNVGTCIEKEDLPTFARRFDNAFTPPFRLGKKQKRAILDANGIELIIMPHNNENQAQMYCDYLNGA